MNEMTKRLAFILAVSLIPGLLFAQVMYNEGYYSMTYNTISIQPEEIEIIDGVATMRYSQHDHLVKGSPFLNTEFLFGVMSTVEAVSIEGLKYRYDIYSDEMQFILKGDTATITKPLILRSIEIGSQKFVYDVYKTGENTVAAGYFEILEEGKLTGLLRREMELDQDIYVRNYGGGGGTKDFYYKENRSNYIKLNKDIAQKISNKKAFIAFLPDYQEQVKAFMKSEKVSVKKPEDIKQIISYYNSLVAD